MSFDRELNKKFVFTVIAVYATAILVSGIYCHECFETLGACKGACGPLLGFWGLLFILGFLVLAGLSIGEKVSEMFSVPPEPPRFDDKRKLMLCADGRAIPFSEMTVHSDHDPGIHTWEWPSIFHDKKWVYLRVGTERINLRHFKDAKQAKEYSREIKKRLTISSHAEPWFPRDD
jgi:hypothetical protein